jgi:hypothetical protein
MTITTRVGGIQRASEANTGKSMMLMMMMMVHHGCNVRWEAESVFLSKINVKIICRRRPSNGKVMGLEGGC